jgi:hypothetical protein
MTTLMQSAADSWPEDEANATHKYWIYLIGVDGEEYANEWLERQRARMHAEVFDNREHSQRYEAELARLRDPKH